MKAPPGREIAVVAGVAAVLALLDGAVRWAEPRLSGNIAHIREIPSIAHRFPAGEATGILVVGNSLIYDGLDLDGLRQRLEARGRSPAVMARVTPDATSLWDWHLLLEKQFLAENRRPDVVLIGFAWHQLTDQADPVPSRLGAFFADVGDLPALVGKGMTGSGDVLEFALANLSRTYANREAIRNRVLDLAVPAYREVTRKLNDETRARAGGGGERRDLTVRNLDAFLALLRDNGVRAAFIAMPVRTPYDVPVPVIDAIARSGMVFLDYRDLPDIDPSMFRDPIHLGEQGRRRFTAHLAGDPRVLEIL